MARNENRYREANPANIPMVDDRPDNTKGPLLKCPFRAAGKKIVLEPVKAPTATRAGLELPDRTQEHFETPTGWVLSVGEDVKIKIAVGDRVVCYAHTPMGAINVGEKRFIICVEEDIVGVMLPLEYEIKT